MTTEAEEAKQLLLREKHVKYYKIGQMRYIFYTVDKSFDGEYKEWWENGQISRYTLYKNGRIDGELKLWMYDGEIFLHQIYEEGELVWDSNE